MKTITNISNVTYPIGETSTVAYSNPVTTFIADTPIPPMTSKYTALVIADAVAITAAVTPALAVAVADIVISTIKTIKKQKTGRTVVLPFFHLLTMSKIILRLRRLHPHRRNHRRLRHHLHHRLRRRNLRLRRHRPILHRYLPTPLSSIP